MFDIKANKKLIIIISVALIIVAIMIVIYYFITKNKELEESAAKVNETAQIIKKVDKLYVEIFDDTRWRKLKETVVKKFNWDELNVGKENPFKPF